MHEKLVDYCGRGKATQKNGQQSTVDVFENMVDCPSFYAYIDITGEPVTQTCGSGPNKAHGPRYRGRKRNKAGRKGTMSPFLDGYACISSLQQCVTSVWGITESIL